VRKSFFDVDWADPTAAALEIAWRIAWSSAMWACSRCNISSKHIQTQKHTKAQVQIYQIYTRTIKTERRGEERRGEERKKKGRRRQSRRSEAAWLQEQVRACATSGQHTK